MRILYLHQYFGTRESDHGARSYEFSRHLVSRGHTVTMLTSGLHTEERLKVKRDETHWHVKIDGIDVVPIAAAYADPRHGTKLSGFQRMREFLRFASLATRIGQTLPRPDIVFATHTPLTIGLPAMELSRSFGVPFVFEVRDLWPDALINCGALKNPLVIWWMRRLAQRIYATAHHIVALSPGMKEGIIRAGVGNEKITVIPNGCDLDLFRPDLESDFRKSFKLGTTFAVIYFGAMGKANGLEYVIEAAKLLSERHENSITIILHGDGGRRPDLERRVREYGLRNVLFSSPVPQKTEIAHRVAACDACLTIYAHTDKEQSWSPNKMFDALSAGKPVLINVPGWLGETIAQNGCGFSVNPRDPADLANRLVELAHDPDRVAQMGKAARALAEREFARPLLANRLERVLMSAIRSAESPPTRKVAIS